MYFLQNWDRLLPSEGIIIFPDVIYKDANDISIENRTTIRTYFKYDSQYLSHATTINTPKGNKIDRKYCIYVYKKDKLLGCILTQEILDNPDGYGKDEFELIKLLRPEYRFTKYARYMVSDFLHFMFKSNIAKKLYSYVPAKSTTSKYFLDVMDSDKMPCIGIRYISDSIGVQKYISVKKIIDDSEQLFAILEFDGKIYNNMNLFEYMNVVPNRKPETINRWLYEMDNAAKQIKELQLG